jgi:hypothetical protein
MLVEKLMDWYWRFWMGLPPRVEDQLELRRIVPELFERDRDDVHGLYGEAQERSMHSLLRREIQDWLRTDDARRLVAVREGSCPQHDCPLRLGNSPGQVLSGRPEDDEGSVVLELMTVAGGWSSKAGAFFDMARKVHGGKGTIKDLLLTDPYIYLDKSEDDTTGGIDNFLKYLDSLDTGGVREITIHQPPYAKGNKTASAKVWRRSVAEHGKRNGYNVQFTFFRTLSETRFHDRFYVARHSTGLISGLFGPSMNGLNDKSFVLMGELEEVTLKRLCRQLDGWS